MFVQYFKLKVEQEVGYSRLVIVWPTFSFFYLHVFCDEPEDLGVSCHEHAIA